MLYFVGHSSLSVSCIKDYDDDDDDDDDGMSNECVCVGTTLTASTSTTISIHTQTRHRQPFPIKSLIRSTLTQTVRYHAQTGGVIMSTDWYVFLPVFILCPVL